MPQVLLEFFDRATASEESIYLYDLLVPAINLAFEKGEENLRKELLGVVKQLLLKSDAKNLELSKQLLPKLDAKAGKKDLQMFQKSCEAAYASKAVNLSIKHLEDKLRECVNRKELEIFSKDREKFRQFDELAKDYQRRSENIRKIDNIISSIANLSSNMDSVKIYSQSGTIETADVKTLNASPVVIVPKPGVGVFLEVVSFELFMDYETTAYDGIAADEDLSLEYETTGQIFSIEATGFLDQASDQRRCAHNVSHLVGINEALVLKMLNGEIATGDSPLKYKVNYRILEAIV